MHESTDSGAGDNIPDFEIPDHEFSPELTYGGVDPSGDGCDQPALIPGEGHTGYSDRGETSAPIDFIEDVDFASAPWTYRQPLDYKIAIAIDHKTEGLDMSGSNEALANDLAHDLALHDLLPRPSRQPPAEGISDVVRTELQALDWDGRLTQNGLAPEVLAARAQHCSPIETIEYALGKLDSHLEFLTSGQPPTNWPATSIEGGLSGSKVLDNVQTTSEAVGLVLTHNREELGDRAQGLTDRHQAWLEQTYDLYISRGYMRAVPLIKEVADPELADAMMERLSRVMQAARIVEGDDGYRDRYGFVVRNLDGPLLASFVAQNEQVPLELTPGAERSETHTGRRVTVTERYVQSNPRRAILGSGETVTLPFDTQAIRTIDRYGTIFESESFAVQGGVAYESLDAEARRAIEIAARAERPEDEEPRYRRLTITPAGSLRATNFDEPGPHYIVPEIIGDQGELLAMGPLVTALQPVQDGFMAFPNAHPLPQYTAYHEADPNLFGPDSGEANVFAVTGYPYTVLAPAGSKNPSAEQGDRRWVLVPVRYYHAELHQPNFENDANRRFF